MSLADSVTKGTGIALIEIYRVYPGLGLFVETGSGGLQRGWWRDGIDDQWMWSESWT